MTASSDDSGKMSYHVLLSDPSLLAVFLISFAALFAVSAIPAALPSISAEFGATESQVGLVMTAFSLPLIVVVPLTAILADMYGRRAIVLPSLGLFGLSGIATLFVTTFPALLAVRALQGIAFAGTVPLTATLIGDLYTGPQGSAAQGIRSSVHGIATTVGPAIAGVLATVAWNYAFLLFVFALPVAILVYVTYPEQVTDTIDTNRSMSTVFDELRTNWRMVCVEAADRRFGVLIGGGFTLFFVKRGVKTFIPVYLVQMLGSNMATAGLIISIYGAVRMFVPPLTGPIVARAGRKLTILGGLSLVTIGTALIPFMSDIARVGVAVALIGTGDAVLNPVLTDSVASFASEEHRGGVMSGLSVSKELANTVSPAILGIVISVAGFSTMFLASATVAIGYTIVVIFAFDSREFLDQGDGFIETET